jgi:hypothetical protein
VVRLCGAHGGLGRLGGHRDDDTAEHGEQGKGWAAGAHIGPFAARR